MHEQQRIIGSCSLSSVSLPPNLQSVVQWPTIFAKAALAAMLMIPREHR
jgi:hypothetical protein